MVNPTVTDAAAGERQLWLLHAPLASRSGLASLLALDDRLGELVATAREPLIGQMRLKWWHDALTALDSGPAPAEPLLRALASRVVPRTGAAMLAAMADGWEHQLVGDADPPSRQAAARARGRTLFTAIAALLGGQDSRIEAAGEGWALAALADRPPDQAATLGRARDLLRQVLEARWPRRLRPLAMLAALALSDLDGGRSNTPARAALLWRVRLFGR